MSLHVFANFVTPFGTAANNRAETEGNITTLQKLLWQGETHSTVSAEAIRFALRRRLAGAEKDGTNRQWDEDDRNNTWKDWTFKGWGDDAKAKTFIDDDLLGYMTAEAAKEEGEAGSANVRRAVLEVTRAVSLTPWAGDVTAALRLIDILDGEIDDCEAALRRLGANHRYVPLLMSTPGIGWVLDDLARAGLDARTNRAVARAALDGLRRAAEHDELGAYWYEHRSGNRRRLPAEPSWHWGAAGIAAFAARLAGWSGVGPGGQWLTR